MIVINDNPVPIKPYSIGELARIYQVDYRTLKKSMVPFETELGIRIGRYYSIAQVEVILKYLKIPSKGIENLPDQGVIYIDQAKKINLIMPDQTSPYPE